MNVGFQANADRTFHVRRIVTFAVTFRCCPIEDALQSGQYFLAERWHGPPNWLKHSLYQVDVDRADRKFSEHRIEMDSDGAFLVG